MRLRLDTNQITFRLWRPSSLAPPSTLPVTPYELARAASSSLPAPLSALVTASSSSPAPQPHPSLPAASSSLRAPWTTPTHDPSELACPRHYPCSPAPLPMIGLSFCQRLPTSFAHACPKWIRYVHLNPWNRMNPHIMMILPLWDGPNLLAPKPNTPKNRFNPSQPSPTPEPNTWQETLYILPIVRIRDFDRKISSNNFFKWLAKYSHPLFLISR
jgi:hypothetical protein